MKSLRILFIGMLLSFTQLSSAQVSVSVNIGSPPMWGPVGYTEVRYYYIPDIEAYYDIQTSMFIYFGGGIWVHSIYLPTYYRYYDLYSGYKVVITDYYGDSPYINFKAHKVKYFKGYKGKEQKTIGNKPGKENKSSDNNSNKKENKSTVKNSEPAKNNGSSHVKENNTKVDQNPGGGNGSNHNSGNGGGGKGGNHGGGKKK